MINNSKTWNKISNVFMKKGVLMNPIGSNQNSVTRYAGVNCGGNNEINNNAMEHIKNGDYVNNSSVTRYAGVNCGGNEDSIMQHFDNQNSVTRYAGVNCGGGALNDLDKEQLLDFINQEQNKQTDIQEKLAEQPQKKIKE